MTTKRCPNYRQCKHFCDQAADRCLTCYQESRQAGMRARLSRKPVNAAAAVQDDLQERRRAEEHRDLQARYKVLQAQFEQRGRELEAVERLSTGVETYEIKPGHSSGTSEATVVVLASDWHLEETVGPELGILKNRFNPKIATQRVEKFFQKTHRLTNLLAQDIKIDTMVLALLGDFITNAELHDGDNAESTSAAPTHAIVDAQNKIASGIEFLLNHSKRKLVIPCHSGNHARTTRKTRFSTENGHSLEYLMYKHLAGYFRSESRVQFIIPDGPHSYINIYDQTVRLQHGHMIKFGGGVGGLFIPAFKAFSQYNKAQHADLDVMGHFHQSKDGGSFLCNGSLIGYNSFALSIRADYETPRQTMFMMDKKRGRTCTWPILL